MKYLKVYFGTYSTINIVVNAHLVSQGSSKDLFSNEKPRHCWKTSHNVSPSCAWEPAQRQAVPALGAAFTWEQGTRRLREELAGDYSPIRKILEDKSWGEANTVCE